MALFTLWYTWVQTTIAPIFKVGVSTCQRVNALSLFVILWRPISVSSFGNTRALRELLRVTQLFLLHFHSHTHMFSSYFLFNFPFNAQLPSGAIHLVVGIGSMLCKINSKGTFYPCLIGIVDAAWRGIHNSRPNCVVCTTIISI